MGLAMRLAMERGAHRRKPNVEKPTVESEQTKRAFWLATPPIILNERY